MSTSTAEDIIFEDESSRGSATDFFRQSAPRSYDEEEAALPGPPVVVDLSTQAEDEDRLESQDPLALNPLALKPGQPALSDSQASTTGVSPSAAISTDALKSLLQLVRTCPYDREIYDTVRRNFLGCGQSRHMLTRHAVSPIVSGLSQVCDFRDRRIQANGGDTEDERMWRITYAQKAVGYVVGTLMASFISETAEFRQQTFLPWLHGTFQPACNSILLGESASLLSPLTEALQSHGVALGGGNSSPFKQFRIMKDKCHICRKQYNPQQDWTCGCGVQCCRACSGVSVRAGKSKLANSAYACDMCLQDFAATYPRTELLVPGPSFALCCQCGCDLTNKFYSTIAARCKLLCKRLYCEQCGVLTVFDIPEKKVANHNIVEKSRRGEFALIECMCCVGREAYAKERAEVLNRLIRLVFSDAPCDPLDMQLDDTTAKTLLIYKAETDAIGDLVFGLRYSGFRDLYKTALPFLMRLASKQIETGVPVCVSPFNMLLFSRSSTPGSTAPTHGADGKMLESICRAHALAAIKQGNVLLEQFPAPEPSHQRNGPGRQWVVVFHAPDLVKQGPRINLVETAIKTFAGYSNVDAWLICGQSDANEVYPPARDLLDFFKNRDRVLWFKSEATPAEKLRLLFDNGLDAVISFPGWTWGDNAELLYVLSKHGKIILNTVGYPGPMHFPEAITATLVGPAIGASQVESSTREAIAIFSDRASYQPPQSHPCLNQDKLDKSAARSEWGLPLKSIIVVCPFSLDRLDPESMPWYFQFLRRVQDAFLLFVERPKGMASQVRAWINAAQDIKSRILFRSAARDTREFQRLLDAADVSLDSFSSYVAHSTAGDALRGDMPHFCTNDPDGLMHGRVAAELCIAAGLEQVCVGKTHQETIDLLVKHVQDPVMQTLVCEFIAENRRKKRGFWSNDRVPLGWMSALTFYSKQIKERADSDKLPDFKIPDSGEAAPVFSVANLNASSQGALAEEEDESDRILRQLEGTAAVEMETELRAMLRVIKIATGVEFLGVAGGGSYLNTIRCREPKSRNTVGPQTGCTMIQ